MGILDIIKSRRSIRKYKTQDISYETILEILEAARWAPSSGNLQNWYFIVVKDPEKKRKIMEYAYGQRFIEEAPVLIIVCSNTKIVEYRYGDRGRFYAIQNVAAAIQNILLAAWERGIGTCWVGAFDENKVKELLKIPQDIDVHAIIAMGYPKEVPEPPSRKSLQDVVYFEEWANRKYRPNLYPLLDTLENIKKELENLKSKLH